MQTRLPVQLAQIINPLNKEDLDLSLIVSKLAHDGQNNLGQAELQYRRFLFIAQKYPELNLVPNKAIDAVWHQHLLYTHKYADDCQAMFGRFLHHRPSFGLKVNCEDAIKAFQLIYKTEFNEEIQFEARTSTCGIDCSVGD